MAGDNSLRLSVDAPSSLISFRDNRLALDNEDIATVCLMLDEYQISWARANCEGGNTVQLEPVKLDPSAEDITLNAAYSGYN